MRKLLVFSKRKNDTERMNDRNIHKVTGQMNHQTSDPKANTFLFLFFSIAHLLKKKSAGCTNGPFGFARHISQPFANPKKPFFANARQNAAFTNFKIINKTI